MASSDDWLCGYAAALGAIRRLYQADTMVVQTLICDGLTIEQLEAAGAEQFDLDAIREAHSD